MGFGVAVALLLDATLIRTVVLPRTLVLLGRWSLYLPNWLRWLPHVEVELGAAGTRGRVRRMCPHDVVPGHRPPVMPV